MMATDERTERSGKKAKERDECLRGCRMTPNGSAYVDRLIERAERADGKVAAAAAITPALSECARMRAAAAACDNIREYQAEKRFALRIAAARFNIAAAELHLCAQRSDLRRGPLTHRVAAVRAALNELSLQVLDVNLVIED
jgi:hypothetical protein